MPRARYRSMCLVVVASATIGPGNIALGEDRVVDRWYTEQQVESGKDLFLTHCAACHGQRAEATTEWRKLDSNANYPPPPLDGSAHAWHHPLSVLKNLIALGGVANGGVMPGFAETLSNEETEATVAYFQHFWSDNIYTRWQKIDSR